MPLEDRVLGLFGELWGEAAREHCGPPAGADRKLLLSSVLKRGQRAGHYCIRSYPRLGVGKKGMLLSKIGAVDSLLLSTLCLTGAGSNTTTSPLCANLRIRCEPDGDIEHQRQVTMYVCMYVCHFTPLIPWKRSLTWHYAKNFSSTS